jgi:hypothetical protein
MTDRIDAFIARAATITSESVIEHVCMQEVADLYTHYTIATVHKMVSRYRNALRDADVSPLLLVHMRERKEASDTLKDRQRD